jgi:hypothetical protein
MSNYMISKELACVEDDLRRPRWIVEKEKLSRFFPQIQIYASGDRVTSIQGSLCTNSQNYYYLRIEVSELYPYVMPKVLLPNFTINPSCPHKFGVDQPCVMRSEQWSNTLSLAFMVAKAAIWLNKYEVWQRTQRWPGKDQHR